MTKKFDSIRKLSNDSILDSTTGMIRGSVASYHDSHMATRTYLGNPDGSIEPNANTLYMGVELEVENRGDHTNSKVAAGVKKISDLLDCGKLAGIESDGSLSNGFEIISEPATLSYHMTKYGWADRLGFLADCGFASHDTSTCGLHVHVSKSALGRSVEAIDRTTALIILLVDKFFGYGSTAPLCKFARRTPNHYCDMNAADIRRGDSRETIVNKAKSSSAITRYKAVNLRNAATVEFRLFKGTLNPETFAATLQLVDTMCRWAMNHTVLEAIDCTFGDIVATCKYPELKAYCTRRGIDLRTSSEVAAAAATSREE